MAWCDWVRGGLAVALVGGGVLVEGAEPATLVKGPLAPADAQKVFRIDDGLTVELVAAEPEVIDPVAVAFGAAGELWVVEMRDYPHGPKPGMPPTSRIQRLTDRDGDGRFETATTFADQLLFATGVLPWRDGVIVTLSGQVAFLADRNGDGVAEHHETWFTGFTEENSQLRANHPTLGPDGWIYIANGLRGGTIRSHLPQTQHKELVVPISGHDFRFHPITGEFEAVSGHGQFGLTFDAAGRRFVCSNRNPCTQIVLDERYLKRNPFLAIGSVVQDVAAAGEASRIYPICNAWTTSTLHAGQFTAACGVLLFQGTGLPEGYSGNALTCDPTGSLVHREVIGPATGAALEGKSPYTDREFLASPDTWFRPVNLAHGPDGCLYVVDMYRAVIEHPQFMPEELQTRRDLYDGTDKGRIWRVRPAVKSEVKAAIPGAHPSETELAGLLAHPNSWQRETAQRLLLEQAASGSVDEVVGVLKPVVAAGNTAESRLLALGLLEVLHRLTPEATMTALRDPAASVVAGALRAWEPQLRMNAESFEALRPLLGQSDPLVRFQLALALGESQHPDRIAALTELIGAAPADPWLRIAVASSAGDQCQVVLAAVLSRWEAAKAVPEGGLELAQQLGEVLGTQQDPQKMAPILAQGLALSENEAGLSRLTAAVVRGLGTGLARRGQAWSAFVAEHAARSAESLTAVPIRLRKLAGDSLPLQMEAVRMARWQAQPQQALPELLALVTGNGPTELKLAALETAGPFLDGSAATMLVKLYGSQTPTVRRAVLDALLANEAGGAALVTALESKDIQPAEVEPTRAARLANHRNADLKARAAALFAAGSADRVQVLKDYEAALTAKGDPLKGRAIFEKNCVTCHRIANLGVNVGPDIGDTRDKTPATLLTNILDPNKAVDSNYFGYTAVLSDGRVFTGIITAETAASITLKQPEGKTETLLRSDLEELKASGQSLMPVGVEKNISVEQMADLLTFLKNWRYLDGNVPLQ